MKKLLFFLTMVAFACTSSAQSGETSTSENKMPVLDKSPMDMAYCPANYPVLKIQDKATEPLLARIIYSRPQKNNRPVFGELVEYNKVWRLGANEATEVEFYRDVTINGKRLPKGKYTMYALVTPEQWTIIFNKETHIWGAFRYDEKKDILRVSVPVQQAAEPLEAFTMVFEKTANGANLNMGWDTVKVSLPIK